MRRRRKKLIFVVVLFFIALLTFLTAVFFFFRTSFVQIKSVSVSGPVGINGGMLSLVPADAVQTEIENSLQGSWLFFFSKNTLFFYPKSALHDELMKEYPSIESLSFDSTHTFLGFGENIGLQVYITERAPSALACANDSAHTCYYMDNTGFVYAPVIGSSTLNFIDYKIAPQSTLSPIIPGNFILDPTSLSITQEIVNYISSKGLDIVSDTIGTDPFGLTNSLVINVGPVDNSDVSNATSTATSSLPSILTTQIYFNQNEPLDIELRYFSDFWQNQVVGTTTKYEYIDMRYGKDIVYKVYDSKNSPVKAMVSKKN